MRIHRFEEIEAWKKAPELTRRVYQITEVGRFSRDFGLRDQIRRAAVSAMSNIAEGFERDGNKELIQFLSIAKGSSGEIKAQLYVALDNGFIDQDQFESIYKLAEDTGRLIGGFIRYLQRTDLVGRKGRVKPGPRNLELGTRNSELDYEH
jgi:four helix bundle protein